MRRQRETCATPAEALPWAESMPEGSQGTRSSQTPVWPRYTYQYVRSSQRSSRTTPYFLVGRTIDPSEPSKVVTVKIGVVKKDLPPHARDEAMYEGFMRSLL